MSKKRRVLVGFAVFAAIVTAFYVEATIYPLSTLHPNFSDVERVFNRMQFPPDWQETRSSENSGIAGRACPAFPESACFHKGKNFLVNKDITTIEIEAVLKSTGCVTVNFKRSEPLGGDPYTNFGCSYEGLDVSGTIYERKDQWELSITVYS